MPAEMSAFDAQEAQHEPRGLSLDTSQGPEYQPPLRQFKVVFLGEHSGENLGWTLGMGGGRGMEWAGIWGINFLAVGKV